MPSPAAADRNLLFGILALQLDFINRDQLVAAMNAWVIDKARAIGDVLAAQQALTAERRQLLDALVAEHLKQHDNDPQKSLAALSSVDSGLRQDLGRVGDAEVQASMGHVATRRSGDPEGTIAGAPLPSWQAGEPAARYRILRPHARGGLGEVYVAEDTEIGRQIALKEIQERHARNPIARTRFMVEAEITGQLEHPGIVPIYGLGNYADGRPFYAMRFIRGDNLHTAIKRFHGQGPPGADRYGSLEFRQLLQRFVDVCHALAYAHSRGVLHRDLKPGNIMLGQYGETLVVDWGLAKLIGKAPESLPTAGEPESTLRPRTGGDSSATVAGQAVGTPAYMSPEQAAGRHNDLGPATDIYSLGATLYELLTGKLPFDGQIGEVLNRIQRGEFPRPRQVNSAIPAAVEAIALKAMALRPGERYTTAQDLAADVEHWLGDEPVAAWREPWGDRARRWMRKHRTAVTTAAALAGTALFALALGLFFVERERARTEERRREAEEQRQLAEQRRVEADRARELADEVLHKMTGAPARMLLVGQDRLLPAQIEFLKDAGVYYERNVRPGRPANEVLEEGARFFTDAATILSKNRRPADAEVAVRKAIERHARLAGETPAGPNGHALAQGYFNLGRVLDQQGKRAEAKAAVERSISLCDALLSAAAGDVAVLQCQANACNNLALLLRVEDKFTEAEALTRRALAAQDKLLADAPADEVRRHSKGVYLHNLGHALWGQKRIADAENAYRAAMTNHEALVREFPEHKNPAYELAMIYGSLGELAAEQKNWPQAEAEYRRALVVCKDLARLPIYRTELADGYRNLAGVYCEQKRHREAADLAEECGDTPDPRGSCQYQAACICALCAAGEPAAADRHAARAMVLLRLAFARGYDKPDNLLTDSDLNSLRSRDEFAALLLDLAEWPAAR